MKELFLVRHGQSIGNVNKQAYYDMLDHEIHLTELGHKQAFSAAEDITNITSSEDSIIDVYCSPYLRAVETAFNIVEGLKKTQFLPILRREDPRLREREWGKLRDINDNHLGSKDHLFDFYYKPEGGESFANVYDRVANFHQWLLTQPTHDCVVVVAHGESIKTYLAYLLGWTPKEFGYWDNPKNCEAICVLKDDTRYSLSPRSPLNVSRYYKPSKIIH